MNGYFRRGWKEAGEYEDEDEVEDEEAYEEPTAAEGVIERRIV